MKIHLNEISELGTDLDFTQEEPWVLAAVEKVDEASSGDELDPVSRPVSAKAPLRTVDARFNLRKVDQVVVVSGTIKTHVRLVCSRCANPFQFQSQPKFSGLFCKDPVMAGVGHLTEGNRPGGQNKGFARHAHDSAADDLMDQGKDLDITYLSNDYVDLSEILTEHLQLQVPFQPLCREECKGMCAQCGADLNVGRCACAKISQQNPFSVLRDLKTIN